MLVGNGHAGGHAKTDQVTLLVQNHQVNDRLTFLRRDLVRINGQQGPATLGAIVDHGQEGADFFGRGLHSGIKLNGAVGL